MGNACVELTWPDVGETVLVQGFAWQIEQQLKIHRSWKPRDESPTLFTSECWTVRRMGE